MSRPSPLLSRLKERVLICDGAMGTQIQAGGLALSDFEGLEGCNEILSVSRPDFIEHVHGLYLDAGADVIETNTFGALPWVLDEFGVGNRQAELCEAAARIAKKAAELASRREKPRFVIGALGPGTKLVSLGQIVFDEMTDGYRQGFAAVIRGGVDALMIETCQDLLQVKAGIVGAIRAMRDQNTELPLFVQVTIEQTGTMLLGSDLGAAVNFAEFFPEVAGIGLNCATGPEEMYPHLRALSQATDRIISVQPNAGLPQMRGGEGVYDLSPEDLARAHTDFVTQFGARLIGGCCGTTPEHIRAVSDAVQGLSPAQPAVQRLVGCSSLYSFQPYDQSPSFLIVGEKTNANGSKKFRELLADEDFDGLVEIAKEQEREGAHMLDVCVAYVGRDEPRDADELFRLLNLQTSLPLVIDTTEWQVAEIALKRIAGKCLINSINFEDGNERASRVLNLCREYGAGVVGLTIDEEGMAKTCGKKVAIAERVLEATRSAGIADEDVFIDCLTFTLGSGDEEFRPSALETIEAVRMVSERFPRANTILGVSNVSFGLSRAARNVLNSAFLHRCLEAGLTSAIVHAGKILPESRIDPEQWAAAMALIDDARSPGIDPLVQYMALFENVQEHRTESEDLAALPLTDRLIHHIVDGVKTGLTSALDEALQSYTPTAIINDILLEGMRRVGDLFGAGKMQLPFVLQSAEVMKAAVSYLEQFMEKADVPEKGSILLATVAGDVHDIGKNLVDIILTNNGYRVHNIGIKQPIQTIIERAREHDVGAIGLSGLLVKSTLVMRDNLIELNNRGLHNYPVILGGAALTRSYVEEDLRAIYKGRVFYAQDAFDGLRLMDELGQESEAPQESVEEYAPRVHSHRSSRVLEDAYAFDGTKSDVALAKGIPSPPFFGAKVVLDVSPEDIYPFINEVALFRGQWGFRRPKDMGNLEFNEYLEERARPSFDKWKEDLKEVLNPKITYGYFQCQSEGNDLIVYRENEPALRFNFPRQRDGRRLCIADFFRPVESGEMDVVAFHIVTVGCEVSKLERKLFEEGSYQDYLYVHGMGVESAEALAEFWHKRIREELGISGEDPESIRLLFSAKYRGCRYSFGYPACPNLDDQAKVMDLLLPAQIGVSLTEEFMLVPEQTTSAVICHHPEAAYFVIR